ncbi:MAG TPA: hypothetical protein PK513_07945 [Alphaproteobacteria bacterium]|nr:hypothetical protein [Alphaproteobacteria bacterium]
MRAENVFAAIVETRYFFAAQKIIVERRLTCFYHHPVMSENSI